MYGFMHLRYVIEGKPAPDLIDIKAALIFAAACVIALSVTGANRAVWRFMSFDDVRRLLSAVILACLITPVILFLFFERAANFPRSAPIVAGILFFIILLFTRTLILFYHHGDLRSLFRTAPKNKPPAILIGRSQTLNTVLKDSTRNKDGAPYSVRGLIETNGSHKGRSIAGVPVIGDLKDIPSAVKDIERLNGIKPSLVFVEDKADRSSAACLVKLASENGTTLVRMRPGSNEGLTPFEAADLIGRQAKSLDMGPVCRLLKGKRVLITGAGGSIGSELAQQVAGFQPAHIALVDSSEMNLYMIDHLFADRIETPHTSYLGDVRDEKHMDEIFTQEKPQIVLHAAALKHVPLMELNPLEAILTNICGTNTVINVCKQHNVESFTLISSDKAVSPGNIMGATKRIAEMMTMSEATLAPDFAASVVRFGNVLSSNGSVIPLFERQIEEGGPVTVTHKDATRFFMTTEEAASLVLQAAALHAVQRTDASAIYVLDMGEPVNIAKIARQLIRLRGFIPDKTIKIKYSGLRPGEKLTEALAASEEELQETYVDGILRITGSVEDPKSVKRRVEKLVNVAQQRNKPAVIAAIKTLIPEFQPNGRLSPKP